MTKHQAKRLEEGKYNYRGYILERHDEVNNYQMGKFTCDSLELVSDSFKSIKRRVDGVLDKKEETTPSPQLPKISTNKYKIKEYKNKITGEKIISNQNLIERKYGNVENWEPIRSIT